jgi:hypothetical protein
MIGAVSPSPNQAAKVCLELGIAPEGEKIAKWVAVLKRELPSSRDFLGRLKLIYDKKQETEMAKSNVLPQLDADKIKINDAIDEAITRFRLKEATEKLRWALKKDMEQSFFLPW